MNKELTAKIAEMLCADDEMMELGIAIFRENNFDYSDYMELVEYLHANNMMGFSLGCIKIVNYVINKRAYFAVDKSSPSSAE